MKILVADFKKKRPWLDCDNGELVHVIKSQSTADVVFKTQISPSDLADEITCTDYVLTIIHIEHQNINQALEIRDILFQEQERVIVYGYGVRFSDELSRLKFAVKSDNVHQVTQYINAILGTEIVYPEGMIVGSDFSDLNIKAVYNYPIRYSKGCENACPFCERSLEKTKEYRSPAEFEAELANAVNRYSTRAITFLDASLLGGNGNRFMEDILPILEKYNILWRANGVTLASIDLNTLDQLKKSGCYLLSIGVESFSANVKTGKNVRYDKLTTALSAIRKSGIHSLGFFICGLEGDTFERAMHSFQLIQSLDMDIRLISSAVALPGTALWKYANKSGRYLCDIQDVFPDKKTQIHFETDDFTAAERSQFLHCTEVLKEVNRKNVELIKAEIQCPWSISEKENIIWEE